LIVLVLSRAEDIVIAILVY